jgi:hypothetical protein
LPVDAVSAAMQRHRAAAADALLGKRRVLKVVKVGRG